MKDEVTITAPVLKRFEVQHTSFVESDVEKPVVLIRLFIQDASTSQLKPSDWLLLHAADAVSFAQLVLQHAQEALGKTPHSPGPKH